jgi:DNA integrity scanning protein DisA with diadenylate cyclase activity
MRVWPLFASLLDEAADVAIVTVAVFILLRTLRTSRARLALVGVTVVGLIDVGARQIGLPLTAWFFQGLFLVSVVVLVLAFQDDLKRLFERLAALGLRRRWTPPEEGPLQIVVRASFALAAVRRGALIVIPGRDPLDTVRRPSAAVLRLRAARAARDAPRGRTWPVGAVGRTVHRRFGGARHRERSSRGQPAPRGEPRRPAPRAARLRG